jgi:mono/diheme cytochrome c family protein
MAERRPKTSRAAGLIVLVGAVLGFVSMPKHHILAGPLPNPDMKKQASAEAGRSVFNGKGACYYCHGVDGYRKKVPQLEADTAALIARLNPQPADLRNPKSLRLTGDKARARAIREGHPGTGMFPDTTMTDRELADTLAYLAVLRKEGIAKNK